MIFGMDALRELLNGESLSLFINDIKVEKNLTKESENLLDFAINIGVWLTFIMLKAVKHSEKEENQWKKKRGTDIDVDKKFDTTKCYTI